MKKIWVVLFLLFMCFQVAFADGPKPLEISKSCTLYPVGWSSKGNFAYIILSVNGGVCGFCPQYTFFVQSLVTDKVLEKKFFDALFGGEKIIPMDKFWEENKGDFYKSFRKYGIEVFNDFVKEKNNFSHKGKRYSVHFKPTMGKFKYAPFEGPQSEYKMLASGKLIMSNGKGSKTIFTYKRNDSTVLSMEPVGFILSPFGSRSAVMLKYKYLDSDGGQDFSVKIIGAHLKVGFK